jgi:hypothetical protein
MEGELGGAQASLLNSANLKGFGNQDTLLPPLGNCCRLTGKANKIACLEIGRKDFTGRSVGRNRASKTLEEISIISRARQPLLLIIKEIFYVNQRKGPLFR